MKYGLIRFEYFLDKLEELFVKSSKLKNPALWLYKNNARNPLFMLEGLAKMYAEIHNNKKISKIKEYFKLLEDAIGEIDYYDTFAKEFATNKKMPAAIVSYLKAQSREKIKSLNEILIEKKWLSEDNNRLEKIRKKLSNADWENEKKDTNSINQFYLTSINKVLEFINKKNFTLSNIERDLHEFRRMIRWLSIYPQALRGCVQLSKSRGKNPYFTKYLTKKITTSPYNVMPGANNQQLFLLLDQNRFYALSWLIAELGNLKDCGLKIEAIKEALIQNSAADEQNALSKVYKLAGANQKTTEQILSEAENLIKNYCKEKNLELLIIGIATVKE